MKLKQFIFALVAMLSFAFSGFAQTVSTEADLKTALQNGGGVTLGASITVSAPVTIPSRSEVVLNLNGKTLKATNAKTKVLENQGKLTINGQGTVSGIIYNGTANGSTAEMTLNGGTYSLDGNNGGLHHYGKTLTINDGVVVKTTSYGVRVSGTKSVLNLYGGSYSSTNTSESMRRPITVAAKSTVNFLDKDITVSGYMHVMNGATINFGENNENSPFDAYHQGNSANSSAFYCTSLQTAINNTDFPSVTLARNVKVAADAPITVNKEINLNLNGKNLSATNAKTTVLKNYANLTIKGKGTVTGLVYNGDAENKGVAEMTLNGGTYKLDGANGGFFNYGKTLTVNDGVTISSQVYGLRMSNAASVINLNGGTFTSTNPTDNMKRAIAVDAGTINFNDDDITINGYFHANRSKAKVNFGEYCPFDAFMYSTTNASGYYVVNLENAIDKADAGYEIVLQKNIERSEIVTLPKKVTLDGNGKTLTSTAGRAINVDCADVVTIENLTIAGATGCERGINIINKAGTTNLKKVNVSGVSYYAVHVATSAGAAQVNIENSNLTGWAAVAAYGDGGTINVKNSNLVGINNYADNGSNSFSTIAVGSNVNVNVAGGSVKAVSQEGKDGQFVLGAQADVTGASITADADLITEGTAKYFGIDLDKNTVAVREVYGTNYVTTPAGNGLVTLTGASEAEVNGVKYAKFETAIKAAKAGDIVTVFEGTYKVPSMKAGITIVGKGNVLFEGTLTGTLENLTMKNIHIKGGNAQRWAYAKGDLVFENVTFEATSVYALHFDGIAEGTNLTYKNCTIIGWAAMGGSPESCVFEGCTIKDNGTYGVIRTYFDAEIKDCTFDVANANTEDIYEDGIHAVDGAKVNVDNCTNGNGDMKDLVNISGASKVTVDGVVYENVAKVDDNYYATLAEAFAAVGDGAGKKVELIANVDLAGAEWTPVNFNGEFDGQNYTISNLVVNGAGKSNQGFFAQTQNGEIKNVTFHNAKVTGRLNVGVVAGTPYTSTYTNVKVTGHVEVNGMAYVGGVGGKNAYANWTDITVDVDGTSYVKATSTENGTAYRTYVGGVIGFNGEGGHTFKNISSNIKVIGDVMDIGGIFGILHYGNNAENITFTGAVEAPAEAKEVGGIAGVWHNEKGQVVTITNAKSEGPVTVGDVTTTGSLVGGAYNANNVTPSTSGSLKVDDKEMWFSVAKIGDTTYRTLAEALTAAKDGETVSLLWAEGEAPIAMNGAVFGKNVTIKGTATVDWSKGFLFVGRGGEGDATVTFDGANLTSVSNQATYGIHVSGREKDTNNKYDGTLVIKNSTIELDYLINKGAMTLDKATLTVKNGFANGGRPAGETENGEDATATMNLTNGSKLVVNNHNGMGLGYEAIGVMNVDATSTFEATEDFLVTAKGTMNVNGGNVIIAGKLTNNGTVVVTGTGKSHLDVKNYSGNAIQLINGNLVDTYFAGRVDAFGTNNISGTTTIGGILGLGYETNPTEQVVVNITGNFNGTNVLVYTNNGVDNILNVGKADGERTKVHFGQLGAFADVNVVNADVTYGYAFIRNDFNATNSTFEIKDGVNTYFSGNAKVVLDNTTWALPGYANIGSYGGYMYGNADVTLKNGSSMTATNLGVEVSGEKVVKITLEDSSSLTATKLTNQGSIVLASTEATLTSNKCDNVTTSVPNQVVVYNNGVYSLVAAVAQIGGTAYTSLQDAINAVKDGETIVLVKDFTGNITLTEKVGLHYTIDGAGKQFKGSISVNSLSDTNDNRRITIKDIKFVDDTAAEVDFITSVNTNHYPRLTIEGCTFTGSGNDGDVAVRLKSSHSVVIKDCTGTGLHSFLQNTSGWNLTIENVKVTESKGAFALGTVQGVTIKGSTIDVATYGIRLDANTYNNNAVIEGNNVTAFIPVVVRKVNTQSNVTFEGENTFTAENNDGKWMVIGTTEYEAGVALPAEVAVGNVVVALNGTNLSYDGVHGAGLAGEGTAEAPYLINNVAELEIFRNSVNAGSAKYSKPGLYVALNANIDLAGINWVGIGSMTADHGFMGNFDGKGFKIQNLTINNPALDSDGYAYAGLFALTEGTDKDNQNVVKNLIIENVTINTTGNIAAAAIAYAYYTNVDSVKVCGNIAITGGDYTAGVLAYTRRCVNASNLAVEGNEGSYIKGAKVVGGVISDIQMNGGLKAVYSDFSAKNIAVIGEQMVGGISGNIATQTLNGATVENVTLTSGDARVGTVAGCFGGTSTITDVTVNNVTGATAVIGATYNGAKAVEARIGDTYYETFAAAYEAAQAGETVTLLADLNMSEILVLDKAITLDGNGKKLTSTAGRAINVDCEGNVGIKNLTINASGERAINVIQKPANVTIENVTAAAANYTVNVAASAGAAKVAITGSYLTGLNVVNVTAPGAEVTINGGTITCNDQTDAECYAALNLTKDAKNGKIVADNVTFDIKGDSKKASNGAEGGVITIDGKADEVDVIVAYISYGNNYYSYTSIEAAIAKAKDGETIGLLRDVKASDIITINKAITLDGNGKTLTSTAARAINVSGANGVTIKDLIINASGERAINVIQNATNVTIDGVTATAANYTVNIAGSAPNAVVAINNSTLNGLCTVNVAAAGAKVTVDNSTVNCNDNNTTAGEAYAALSLNKEAVGGSIVATNTTVNVAEGSDSMKGRNSAENGTVTINGSTDGVAVTVAVITYEGSDYYHSFASLAKAVEFAKAGDVITLIRDVTVAQPVVINKSVTLDGNGKTLTYTGTDRAIEMPNVADANYDVTIKNLNVVATTANRGLNYNDNGKLNVEGVTVTIGEKVDGYAINFPGMADGAQVTIKDSKLTSRNPLNIWGENMVINVYDSEIISVENSSTYDYAAIQLNNDLYGTVANGTVVNVYGGSITATNEKGEPSNVVANSTETGVVNISDETVVSGEVANYVANIGGAYFASLQAAVNAIEKHGYNSPIVIMKSFSTSEATTIKKGLKVTINLNGKTITGTDNATGSFGLITNSGELTINGEGAITLVATNNREWNAYSSVISNTVGGKLTVNGGTIQHLGGTDMAYGIDNLTNGKGTYAETIINGGAVKSTYRAVRQFLNGIEAQNILTVNGGTIEGANKSIWMQDPSKNSNTGTLTVGENASLNGDVYLFVTAGSTEWPVSVSIAAAALQGESKVVSGNVPAGYDVAEVNGAYGVYTGVAKIGTAYYETLKAAVEAAQVGETITLLADIEATEVILLGKSLTINGNGYKVTSNATRVFRVTTSDTKVTLNDVNMVSRTVMVYPNDIRGISIDAGLQNVELTLNNCSVDFTDATACDWAYAVNVSGNGTGHTVTVNGGTYEGANVINVHGANNTVTVKDATLTSLYPNNAQYYGNCIWVLQNQGSSVEATGNTFNGSNAIAFNLGTGTVLTESENTDNTKYVVAMIGDAYYTSIQAAVEAAQDGETIKLTQNVKTSAAGYTTITDGYAVIVAVKEKKITLDLNGKSVTVNVAATDVAEANSKFLMAVFGVDTDGNLTLTGKGSVKVVAEEGTLYSLAATYGEGAKLTIENGSYEANAVHKSGSLIYAHQQQNSVTVNDGTYKLGNLATGANGSPWIFNTLGKNMPGITVNGGTYPTDINHQFWFNEVIVPETLALKANEDGKTWTVVPAAAYTNEKNNSQGSWRRNVGYATIEEAIAATQTRNCEGNVVTLAKNVEIEQMITVANGVEVTLDLNGKTLAAIDNTTKNYSAIDNRGTLTIVDSSEDGTGKITVEATVNSGWNRYSAVIANNPGGKLTVEAGTIEHLGGTDMAYGIDNLTNGKGTYAETTISGGLVKSTYRAVRQFLNGVEAQNILTVNGGTLEGANKSIFFHDPSTKANSGTLYVGAEAALKGDVYLFVTAGSTEWPVEVYIAKDALGESTAIVPANVPADAAELVEYDEFWQVEQKNLAALTIEDACEEYINKIEKNVGVLTYERHFDDTEWQTIVLPFDVPVANLMEQFEVAYIYNASYKNGKATIDYVVIEDDEFVLAANYPYMIKAKATGWNNIVVENAKLMPTDAEILDCSSIFEQFSFIGNYATVGASDLDATMGYFNLTSGAWSKMDEVNPFRFYMQIKLRNGAAFEYPTDSEGIRMRRVDENGNADTTGIDGVEAENAGDFIFDLHGRRVLEPLKGGLYIINGKKVIF